jgi:hypothetical protein
LKGHRIYDRGFEGNSASSSEQNGTELTSDINAVNGAPNGEISPKIVDKTNQDIVRLIGQHLKTVGLKLEKQRQKLLQ